MKCTDIDNNNFNEIELGYLYEFGVDIRYPDDFLYSFCFRGQKIH